MKFKLFVFTILIISQISCKKTQKEYDHNLLPGLASPIMLSVDTTWIEVQDYFPDIRLVKSFKAEGLLTNYNSETGMLWIKQIDKKPLYVLHCLTDSNQYDIPVFPPKQLAVSLTIQSDSDQVYFVGEPTNWVPSIAKKQGNIWVFDTLLLPGTYQYQWVLGNKWILDPNNLDSVSNNQGGFNSLLKVNTGQGVKPNLHFEATNGANFVIHADEPLEQAYVFWENMLVETKVEGQKIVGIIPSSARKLDKSYLRAWGIFKGNLTADVKIPIVKGSIVTNARNLNRHFYESQVLYFMMVDRFHNGDSSNDYRVTSPPIHPKANYYGGDLAGILAKLRAGYFEQLNINTIWLSPITQNAVGAFREFPEPKNLYSGYHGYWPTLSTKVDFRFGDEAILKTLVEEAHQRNINLILDYVANHVHKDHHLIQKNPDWATTLDLGNGRKNIRLWDEHRLTTWFDDFLPSLDYSKPEVVETMSDSAIYWIKTFGLDGFRHDATKHIPEVFWKTLTKKLKNEVVIPENRTLYQIGETFGSRQLIGSYVSSGQLDAQFDFNLYFDAVNVFAKDQESTTRLATSLQESLDYYGYNHTMGNISGNHDLPRFIAFAGEALSWEENEKAAGYSRDVSIKNRVGYDKLRNLLGFLFSIPGVPIVYYGDEIGMVGAGDPDNRRPMKFENLSRDEQLVKNTTEKLTNARRTKMPLLYGSTQITAPENYLLQIMRLYNQEASITLINKSNAAVEMVVQLPKALKNHNFMDLDGKNYQGQQGSIKLTIPAQSFILLTQ